MANRGEICRERERLLARSEIREKCGKMNIVDSDWRFHNLCGSHLQSQKMTTAQVVETSVTVNNNSPILDYVHPDDQTQPTFLKMNIASQVKLVLYRSGNLLLSLHAVQIRDSKSHLFTKEFC